MQRNIVVTESSETWIEERPGHAANARRPARAHGHYQFPVGEDVKVMGTRVEGQISLTCAVPFMAGEVADNSEYQELKTAGEVTLF